MNSAPFDPRQAAELLDQTTRRARRTFTPLSPLLFMVRAVVVLGVFGGFWVSVRGEHPYTGHISGWAIGLAVVLVLINIGWAAWIIGYAITAPLYHAGVSHPAWGLYPASAPLPIIGPVSAAVWCGRDGRA